MGYFANGSEGSDYQSRYCDKCVHDIHDNCPIWTAHLVAGYAEMSKPESLLHQLIPLTKDGDFNEECRLFHQRQFTPS
jgi:hypothetical protein